MTVNLDGRVFRPISNSDGGRVDGKTLFHFSQTGQTFTATYSGPSVRDGHLIGRFLDDSTLTLLYHSRSTKGELEAGEATAQIDQDETGRLTLDMTWKWLNGSRKTGTSNYVEILPDEMEDRI